MLVKFVLLLTLGRWRQEKKIRISRSALLRKESKVSLCYLRPRQKQKELNLESQLSFWYRGMWSIFVFFKVDRYFGFAINAENATLHKHTEQNSRRVFRTISETVGNSVLIPSQNSFNEFS